MLQETMITAVTKDGRLGFFRSAEGHSVALAVRYVISGWGLNGTPRYQFTGARVGVVIFYDTDKVERRPRGLFATYVMGEAVGRKKAADTARNAAVEKAEAEQWARSEQEIDVLLSTREAELREFKLPEPTAEAVAAYAEALGRQAVYSKAVEGLGREPSIPGLDYRGSFEPGTCVGVKWRVFEGLYEAFETVETRQEEGTASYGDESWGTGTYYAVTRPVICWKLISGNDVVRRHRDAVIAITREFGSYPPEPRHPSLTPEFRDQIERYREEFATRLGVPVWILAGALGRQ